MSDNTKPTKPQLPSIKIGPHTPAERGAINILTPQERKEALLQAARAKAAKMFPAEGEDTQG